MKVVITGASSGMGLAAVKKFLNQGHEVVGIDILPMRDNEVCTNVNYVHYVANVSEFDSLPDLDEVNILINSAGMYGSGRDIDINLKGLMNTTKKYALDNPQLRAVVNQASASAHLGTEYDEYVASKGGVIAYTKWTAKEIAKYGAVCNSLSFGGVLTEVNAPVMNNQELWNQIMDLTPLKRWTTPEEAAEWIYFLAITNRSCSGQDIMIDNLESLNGVFVWE